VLAAATLSGMAGLGCEVAWTRMLVVPLGGAADATALVLASFMLGLALGARVLGALADRVASPLGLYARVEAGLALCAVGVPMLIATLGAVPDPFRMIVAALIVVVPSALMGAAVPALARGLAGGTTGLGGLVGLVYGCNTAGGAAGAAAAGFALVPELGLQLTSWTAGGASLLAAAIATLAGRRTRARAALAPVTGAPRKPGIPRARLIAALAAAAGSGAAMLGLEVLWARVLTFVFGHDTYAFASLLVVVLLGIGIGGLAYRWLARSDPAAVAAWSLGLLALTALGSFWIAGGIVTAFGRDPFGLAESGFLATSLRLELYRELLFTPILVLAPAVAAGISFPAAAALLIDGPRRAGAGVGLAILANGVACAAGSLLTSFVLVPGIGIASSFVVLAAVAAVAALPAALLGSAAGAGGASWRRVAWRATPVLVAALIAALLPMDLPRRMLLEAVGPRHQELLHYEEGRAGTIAVTRNRVNGERQLFVNAVNEVTTRLVHDQSFKALGHLGPLLHPRPERGLMICLGAGLSAGAALVHPLKQLDVVELSPSIPAAARLFTAENNGALDDPRLSLHIGDGRRFLTRGGGSYDVMLVDSTHPKAVDSWMLYTREFYAAARTRLAEDGILVQWVPLHGLSEDEFKIIVRTFLAEFPDGQLWVSAGFEPYGPAAYAKLIGGRGPFGIDYQELSFRLAEPRIARDLAPYGMDAPEEILDGFVAGPAALDTWTRGLPIQTDDRPFLAYLTRHSAGRRMSGALLLAPRGGVAPLLSNLGRDEAAILEDLGSAHEAQGFVLAGLLEPAIRARPAGRKLALFAGYAARGRDYYLGLAPLYDGDPGRLFEVASYLGNLGFPAEAQALYARVLELDPGSRRAALNLALLELDLGAADRAVARLRDLVTAGPGDPLLGYNLGAALLAAENPAAAIVQLEAALAADPDLHGARLALADAWIRAGRLGEAEKLLGDLMDRAPWIAEAWDMLGLVEAARGNLAEARDLHGRALQLDPYRLEAHYNLGLVLHREGRLEAAARAFQAVLSIDPDDAGALDSLGLVHASAGHYQQAADLHRRALLAQPHFPEAAYNLGLAYRALGDRQQAVEAFALALQLAPGLLPAREQLDQLGIDDARIEIEAADAGVE
jgi:tetratricopeptide (TPR) repeat protein/spermidine synthase